MNIVLSVVFLVVLVISLAAALYSFRLGASVYHSGMRQGPVSPVIIAKKEEEMDEKEKKEDNWDNT